MSGFITRSIHGAEPGRTAHGALRVPVFDNAAFEFPDSESLGEAFAGRLQAHSYSRISNPTVTELEQKINGIAEGFATIALSSGMAAIANVFLAVAGTGDSIISSRYIFGNTLSLFEHTLKPWGLQVRYADFSHPEEIERSIDGTTRAIFLETITNPQLAVFDIDAIAEIAGRHRILLILDNTVTTPYLFRAKDHGVHLEAVSTTKYISGGGTAIGGVIIDYGGYDWSANPRMREDYQKYGPFTFARKLRREVYRNLGACMAPQNAFLHTLGLESMALRIDRSCANALALAEYLRGEPAVRQVAYPGLEDNPYHTNARKLLPCGYGGILTFELGSREECFAFMDRLKIVRRATNINDNKSLVIHPASTLFCEYSAEQRRELGVGETMLRLSVGIEDFEDLREDIDTALKKSDAERKNEK